MGLFGRDSIPETIQITYARCLDGRHLWVDPPAGGELMLVGDGVELPVGEGPVALPDTGPELRLVAGRRATPVAWAGPDAVDGPTRDPGPWQVNTDDGTVRLTHTATTPLPVVRAFVVGDDARVEVEHSDGVLVLDRLDDLAPGTTRRLGVVRAHHVLARPNAGVVLPPLPEPGAELRWLKDGVLAVHRKQEPAS